MAGRALDSTVATEDEFRDVLLELQALLSSEANRSMKNKVRELTRVHRTTFHLSACFVFLNFCLSWSLCYHRPASGEDMLSHKEAAERS